MGTPDNKQADSLSQDVNASNDKGVNETPEEVDYKELYDREKKRARDNQAAFTKSRQELSVLKKEAQLLEEKLRGSIVLPAEQQEELEALKYEDPDAWFAKKQQYEQNVLSELEKQKEVKREEALQLAQKQTQEDYIANWLTDNPEISMDMIQLDVPPRIHKAYEEGTLSIDEFLEKSKEYLLKTTKKLVSPKTNDVKDLNKIPGGGKPSQSAVQKQNDADTALEIY